jgi:hypothetical protein
LWFYQLDHIGVQNTTLRFNDALVVPKRHHCDWYGTLSLQVVIRFLPFLADPFDLSKCRQPPMGDRDEWDMMWSVVRNCQPIFLELATRRTILYRFCRSCFSSLVPNPLLHTMVPSRWEKCEKAHTWQLTWRERILVASLAWWCAFTLKHLLT